jgi:hypothetical protein
MITPNTLVTYIQEVPVKILAETPAVLTEVFYGFVSPFSQIPG